MARHNFLSTIGLIAVTCLLFVALGRTLPDSSAPPATPVSSVVRLIAVGDVNLGRQVGQEILRGDTLFPFSFVRDTFATYDIVFANLECTLSDQEGETQHPKNNLIFTGPPAGGATLKRGGVTVVSTANNHALDYGVRAHAETITYLNNEGVKFTGTSKDSSLLYSPLLFTKHSIRFALLACTDVMNIDDPRWKRFVAEADTGKMLPAIRASRQIADVVIVSYHGGEEYTPKPVKRTEWFAEQAISAGADLFLGHHPHVPHGIKSINGRIIAYSLGNFVFYQPFQEWTQRSFALSLTFVKDAGGVRMENLRCLPVISGLQPYFTSDSTMSAMIRSRLKNISSLEKEVTLAW